MKSHFKQLKMFYTTSNTFFFIKMLRKILRVLAIYIYEQVLINFILRRGRDNYAEKPLKENPPIFFISKFSKIFCIKYIGRFFKRIFSIFVPVSDNHYYLLI